MGTLEVSILTEANKMAENFNIAVLLERVVAPDERSDIVLALASVYEPYFGRPYEVCVVDYMTGLTECEHWPEGERFIKHDIKDGALVFVYGNQLVGSGGARCNVHVEEGKSGTLFVVSLPLPQDFDATQLERDIWAARSIFPTERYLERSIVAAGWELELDVDDGVRGVLADLLSCDSLSSWILIQKDLAIGLPSRYFVVSESKTDMLVRRK